MKVRPILFSAPMINALLDGRKTQTRRVVKNEMAYSCLTGDCPHDLQTECDKAMQATCPYGQPGDLLWCRETWATNKVIRHPQREKNLLFKADYRDNSGQSQNTLSVAMLINAGLDSGSGGKWKPSIFMPRIASRLTLETTGVRVERLQDISEEDARAEGVKIPVCRAENGDIRWLRRMCGPYIPKDSSFREHYALLWSEINGEVSWNANPWVWALTFRVHRQNVDDFLKGKSA